MATALQKDRETDR